MRISDWSSDVCSSDLAAKAADAAAAGEHAADPAEQAAIAAGRPSRGIATEEAAQHISQASLSIQAAQSIWSRRVLKACPVGRRHAGSQQLPDDMLEADWIASLACRLQAPPGAGGGCM